MRRVLTVAVVVALGVAGFATGVVLATDDPNVIHACVNNNTGRLSVVTTPGDCAKNETPLDWNQQGTPGPQGLPGLDGVSGYEIVVESFVPDESISPGQALSYTVVCPSGKKALNGGGPTSGPVDEQTNYISRPTADGSGWTVDFNNGSAAGFPAHELFAICALVN